MLPIDNYAATAKRVSPVFVRVALGVVLLWIGALKFADPTPVVDLLKASMPFLAYPAVVYALAVAEVAAAMLLFSGKGLQYASLLLVGLFSGTLLIFVIAPGVSYGDAGFPFLALPGQFLIKDIVLMAASVSVAANRAV